MVSNSSKKQKQQAAAQRQAEIERAKGIKTRIAAPLKSSTSPKTTKQPAAAAKTVPKKPEPKKTTTTSKKKATTTKATPAPRALPYTTKQPAKVSSTEQVRRQLAAQGTLTGAERQKVIEASQPTSKAVTQTPPAAVTAPPSIFQTTQVVPDSPAPAQTPQAVPEPFIYEADVLDKKANDNAVNHLYQQYLGRDATAPELANWGARGGRDTTVRALETFLKNELVKYGVAPSLREVEQAIISIKQPEVAAASTPPIAQTLSPTPAPPDQFSTGLEGVYKELYDAAKIMLDELQRRGETVNTAIEITPEKAAEFMKKAEGDLGTFLPYAEKEILPYYQNQLKVAREGFLTDLGYSRDQILRNELDLERQYGQAVRQLGEGAAESGFAQSGIRQREERQLAEETGRNIAENRRQFEFGAGQAARNFAGIFGTGNTPGFSIGGAPGVGAGEGGFTRGTGELPLYNLSDETYRNLKGSQEYEQEAAVRRRASDLEGGFRAGEALRLQRSLN